MFNSSFPRSLVRSCLAGAFLSVLTATPCLAQSRVPQAPITDPTLGVFTYHNDNQRTGQNPNETVLTPANVNPNTFGKIFFHNVDGAIYTQPLYVPQLTMTNPYTGQTSTHNVIIVATEHNSVYAFDADSAGGTNAGPLWHTNFNYPLLEITPVPNQDVQSDDIAPEIGITGTPVIDPNTGTLYVVAKTREVNDYHQRLHALDITTGFEKFGGPVDITAQVPGQGDDSDGTNIFFDPLTNNQRPALLLSGGILYIAFSSHGDNPPYHGWVLAYNPTTLQQVGAFATTPNGLSTDIPAGAGIWMGGAGPAVDGTGSLFLSSSNGLFDADPSLGSGTDYAESVLKLHLGATTGFTVNDFFTPYNQADLSLSDIDLGSGGVLVLPNQPGAYPHLLVTAGKEGKIYLVNRDGMGHYHLGDDSQIVEELPNAIGGSFGMPAYFNQKVYYGGVGDVLKAFDLVSGQLTSAPTSQGSTVFDYPGVTPSISSNGSTNGIVWAVEGFYPPPPSPILPAPPPVAVLHAFDASDVSKELYSSRALGGLDSAGLYTKFVVPTVANGRVYVGGNGKLTVYGLRTAGASQIDHFLLSGPLINPSLLSCIFTYLPTLVQYVNYSFSITAIDDNGNPVNFTGPAYVAARRFDGALRFLSTANFKNQSNVVKTYSFRDPLAEYEMIVTDGHGHTAVPPYDPLIPEFLVFPSATNGLDHFNLRAPSTTRNGQTILLTINAVTANGTPIPVNFPGSCLPPLPGLWVYDTLPSGTQVISPCAPNFAYNLQYGAPFIPALNCPVNYADPVTGGNTYSLNVPIVMQGVGKHVVIVIEPTSGITDTTVVTVTP